MRLYYHYCPGGFSNSYILGTDFSDEKPQAASENAASEKEAQPLREAIIVDPGIMDPGLLALIEENDYTLRGVFITHDHPHHVRGLRTIMKIYDTGVYAVNPEVMNYRTMRVMDGDIISLGPFKIEVITIPGHSADSAAYVIDRLIFSGDALSAGLTGKTASFYSSKTQKSALHNKLMSLPGDYTVLPGHGPPSSLEAERRFNINLNSFEQQKKRRHVFDLDYD